MAASTSVLLKAITSLDWLTFVEAELATSTLRNVGGSVMMTIPKAVVDELGLTGSTKVDVTAEDGPLVAVPHKRPKYTLEKLLAQCDFDAPWSEAEREWMDAPAVGNEIID